MRGQSRAECSAQCGRNGLSCQFFVNGDRYQLCRSCSDWQSSTQAQRESFHSNEDCLKGCDVQPPTPATPAPTTAAPTPAPTPTPGVLVTKADIGNTLRAMSHDDAFLD